MKLTTLLTLPFLLTPLLAAPNPNPAPAVGSNFRGRPKPYKPSPPDTKYFHEPGGNDELGHYDIRYFKAVVSYEERGDTLLGLIRSYLTVFREKNIETWIAHGTLLGWWWNGKIMPWDWDLDTQVSASTLVWMGQNLNMTLHNFTVQTASGEEQQREYLLDVNPNHVDRMRGDGMNVIDARWIDVRNGLYIDITGLSETNPSQQPGVWSCKNYHHYKTRDIYPLRETEFEGVPATVPFGFDRILVQEYSPRALTKTMHEGHTWNPEQKEWIKNAPQGNLKLHPNSKAGRSHMPRSLLGDEAPRSGLGNLLRTL
ncbi:uncharacterized protein LY89DRAFT_676504 [Mollisia scopiformis]|uniref:LicD/FKTN/FKRP nucleotidyltransferase domain-containing protein n=1 Tax=Mollisia scopiformis TaxID=149040 RepID=A0A132B9Q6_MOLSC|nr:uncharacterized protein LY89DRAFT_676504 [Mollisia scopiformis]KUJ09142.1 hypothetical protein LY89DRAFT_676504 [Mollisia scopiformis]